MRRKPKGGGGHRERTSGEAVTIRTCARLSRTRWRYLGCTLKYPDVQSILVLHPPGAEERLSPARKMEGTTRSVSCEIPKGPICSTGRRIVSRILGSWGDQGRVDWRAEGGFFAQRRVREVKDSWALALKAGMEVVEARGEGAAFVAGQVMEMGGLGEEVSEAVARKE